MKLKHVLALNAWQLHSAVYFNHISKSFVFLKLHIKDIR